MRRLNGYVSWLPGNELPLTTPQNKQALYDAMAPTWRDKFEQTGREFHNITLQELVVYFRTLERAAQRNINANNERQEALKQLLLFPLRCPCI
jgi:hypothetical protein